MTLTLYSRPECHLCETFLAQVLPLLPAGVTVAKVDVDSSVTLERRFGHRIPVLVAGDVELSGYPLEPDRVRDYLRTL